MKPVVVRPRAGREIDDAAAYYAALNADLGASVYDEVDVALEILAEDSSIGSPRYSHIIQDVRLRVWPIARFPYLIFYLDHDELVEVVRFLHTHRDLPAALRDSWR